MAGKRIGRRVSDVNIARPMGSGEAVGKTLGEIRKELIEENFGDIVDLIKSKKIRDFVEGALSQAPREFWIAPASSTGKHHPPENNVKGGLVVHTRKGIRVILNLFRLYGIEDQLLKDKMIAGFILHDIGKGGDPWEDRTDPEHGPKAAHWLAKIAAIEPEPEKEDFFHIDQDLWDVILLV
ncbi:MAG: hypothetical protein U9N53_15320, partial [Bacteroidota bacterium]|nr:hypothetical protein [Bacteroidota bacterium]